LKSDDIFLQIIGIDMSFWLSEMRVAFVSRSEDQLSLLMAAVLDRLKKGKGFKMRKRRELKRRYGGL